MTRDELLAFAERRLTAEEFRAYIDAPMTPEEREGILELVHWFERRYPTPLERLTYARQAYARWKRARDGA
jgi:hypothetical protein